jgi:hypothetical protein
MKVKSVANVIVTLSLAGSMMLMSHTAAAGNVHGSWSRTRSGPHGGTVSHSGSCSGGSGCSHSTVATGPSGQTWTSQHSAQANGHDGLDRSATYSGPNGSVSRAVQTDRYPNG